METNAPVAGSTIGQPAIKPNGKALDWIDRLEQDDDLPTDPKVVAQAAKTQAEDRTCSSKKGEARKQRELIEQAIEALFDVPGTHRVIELRIPKAGRWRTISGYFDDRKKLAAAIEEWSGKEGIQSIYYTLNVVNPDLLARCANRAKSYAEVTTADRDIQRRVWFLIDCDPVRPAYISSTDAEKKLAERRAKAVRDYLRGLSWPEPLVADSGNGYHLLYRVDLPNDETSAALLQHCLQALAAEFDDEAVKIDPEVFNASRVVKAYGSLAAKGDSTSERPHRVAKLRTTAVPGGREIVPLEKLQALAKEVPKPEPVATGLNQGYGPITSAKMEEFLAFYGVGHKPQEKCSSGTKWVLDECVFNPEHKKTSAVVILRTDGKLGYECLHASCQSYHWKEFRAEMERRAGGKRFRFCESATGAADQEDCEPDEPRAEVPETEDNQESEPEIPPLSSAALYGILGEFVERQLPETEADAAGLLFQALAAAGNFLGPNPYFRVRATKHRANLYVCEVGKTASAKGEGLDCVNNLFQTADPGWRTISGLNSGEGVAALADSSKDKGDEGSPIEDTPPIIKPFCFNETEFARLLAAVYRQGNTAGAVLREAWDKVHFQVINKNSPLEAYAYITMIGHITPSELATTLAEADISNGFANRFLWVAVQRSKDIPGAGVEIDWRKVGLVDRLLQARKLAAKIGEMELDGEANELWQSVYSRLRHRPDNTFGKVTGRACPNVKRIAMIFALLPNTSHGVMDSGALGLLQARKIGVQPLQAALEAWRYSEDSVRQIFQPSGTGGKVNDPEVYRCRLEVNSKGGQLTKKELERLFSHKNASQRIEIATRAGLKLRQMPAGKPGGKPTEILSW